MDPQETLYNLLENIRLNDRAAVDECLTTLAEWNRNGGFLPTVDRPDQQSVSHYVVRRTIPETETGPVIPSIPSIPEGDNSFDPVPPTVDVRPGDYVMLPGDYVMLPEGWCDDWCEIDESNLNLNLHLDGPLEVGVVQRWTEVEDSVAIVSSLDDESRESRVGYTLLQWGRDRWLQENSVFGTMMGCLDER